ncbi:MAG: elongation factor P [Dehalococcoidia bacterium]|nr:elongation factor P [Dehalococcoidia bacterium]
MPSTITYSDLRRGTLLELDGEVYQVMDFKHVIMQQRTPTLTLKLRQLRSGKTFERNLPGYTKLTVPDTETKEAQYLFTDGQSYTFMDTETYDQFPLPNDKLGDLVKFLTEGATVTLLIFKGEPVTITLPNTVDLKVTDAPSSYRGDTAQGGRKPVTLETGLIVNVPMHVNKGQVVKVDTRTGDYVALVK